MGVVQVQTTGSITTVIRKIPETIMAVAIISHSKEEEVAMETTCSIHSQIQLKSKKTFA